MSFLNPLALWLLLIVPLIFLARRRPTRQRVPVANLYLWQVATPSGTSALTRRFRRHWLFLLQAFALLALIFASARPLLSIGARSVVIIDTSLSMSARDGSRTRLDEAKARAAAYVNDLAWNARVRVISAAGSPKDLGEFRVSDPALKRTLAAIGPSAESGDLAAAIQLARSQEMAPGHIEVFSDLSSPVPPSAPSDLGWSVIGKPAGNVAITALGVLREARTAYASIAVTNYTNVVATRTVVVEQGGSTLTREQVEIDPGRTRTMTVVAGLTDGRLTARIDGEDALPEDDRRWADVPTVRRLRVLLTSGSFFLEKALRAHPDVEVITDLASGATTDVVVCAACSELPAGNSSVLLIAAPDDALAPSPMTVSAVDHPLLDGVGLGDLSITPVAMRRKAAEGTVIVTAGDLPAIVAYSSGQRRVVEWRFNVSNGAVPLSPAFPLLVANALEWLTAEQRPATDADTTNESDLRTTRMAAIPATVGDPRDASRGPAAHSEVTVLLLLLALGTLVIEWRHRRTAVRQV